MSPTISRRTAALAALATAAGIALSTVADATPSANVPSLPAGTIAAHVLLSHDGPEGYVAAWGTIAVESDASGSRLTVSVPVAELTDAALATPPAAHQSVVDADAEPDTYAAGVALIAATLAAVDAGALLRMRR